MREMCLLTDLAVGQKATVETIYTVGAMRRRLQDIGIIEGTRIECAFRSPSNDPVAYQIRGAVVAIRNEDGKNIVVSV